MEIPSNKRWHARNIVIDLEFTPVSKDHGVGGLKQEIIEIGAVKLDDRGEFCGEFSRLVSPELADGVERHVKALTSISSYDAYNAEPLNVVLFQFQNWIGDLSARMITWSGADKLQLKRECRAKRIPTDRMPGDWLDIQPLFPALMGIDRELVALEDAAEWYGISAQDEHLHHALTDARITAGLLKGLITRSLVEQPEARAVRERLGRDGSLGGEESPALAKLRKLSALLKVQEALG